MTSSDQAALLGAWSNAVSFSLRDVSHVLDSEEVVVGYGKLRPSLLLHSSHLSPASDCYFQGRSVSWAFQCHL